MKVVVVAQEFSSAGGAEKAACAHVELLERDGHAVRLVGDFRSAFPGHEGLQIEGIALRRYGDIAQLGPLAKARMALRGLFDPRVAIDVYRYLRRERPEIVHLHKVKRLSPALYVALRLARVRVVATLHDHYLGCLNSSRIQGDGSLCDLERCRPGVALRKRCVGGSTAMTVYASLELALRRHAIGDLRTVDRYLFPSRFLQERTARGGVRVPGRVLHNFAVDPVGPRAPAPRSPAHALYFGRLSEEKGVRLLPRIAERLPAIRLRVVGDGPLRAWLEAEAAALPAGNLEVAGPAYGDALRGEIEAASVVLLPSLCFENGPLAAIEAMALGRPLVAADIGGIPELVIHEQTGLLHASGDDEAAARCVARLVGDDALRMRLAAGARHAYEARHTPDRYLSRTLEVYRAVRAGEPETG